ncbi:hypothetical protein PCO86_16910 [Pectobacteriaceae bacterium CE70]|nr:hypothetical protein [Serratia sp. ATCC 39006]WJV61665.1 hypothetical protein PCO87_17625 [Pectobacteriaceae bacterium C52]WJV65941.1 hypothetical protein PCO86_16910 [Pectobacteriaceae bacterium CE70]WJY09958.1 hypothetical protein PCO80_16850 [Pectobacteriaceae bacterium C80]
MTFDFLLTSLLVVISRPSMLIWMRRSFAFAFVLLGIKLASSAQ